jgi:hypothetical protein
MDVTFNTIEFLVGTTGGLPNRRLSPIFRVTCFRSLMNLETYVRRFPLTKEKVEDRNTAYLQIAKSLSFMSHVITVCEEATTVGFGRFASFRKGTDSAADKTIVGSLAVLQFNHLAGEACTKRISLLPHSAVASGMALDGLFLNNRNVLFR